MSRLSIYTQNEKFPIAPNLYGIFFEDINRAGDGGLNPEMIRNTSFEDSILPNGCESSDAKYSFISPSGWKDEFNNGEGLQRWMRENKTEPTSVPGWYKSGAEFELDENDTLNSSRKAALKVAFDADGQIYNTGFCGVAVEGGEKYSLTLFGKSISDDTEIEVGILDENNSYASETFLLKKGEYEKHEISLMACASNDNCRFYLSSKSKAEIKLGFVSLLPKETYKGHGLRKDLCEKLEGLKPGFLRFPGGCIVEGFTKDTAMKFVNTIGPVWERPGQLLMWHYHTSNAIGFHEYLQLCEDMDMEPLYVCNCGMTCQARCMVPFEEGAELDEMLNDCLNAIEYAIGDSETTFWGKKRAENGHEAPFRMNYIEIGNENSGPVYEYRYKLFFEKIKEKYPHIVTLANSHLEEKGLPTEFVDEHYYNTAEYFAESTDFFDSYDRKGPEIFLGELSVVKGFVGTLYAAIGEAAFLLGVEKNQDIVTLTSYAPLLQNIHYKAWFPNLIMFDNHRNYAIPSYYSIKMLSNNRGDMVVGSKCETDLLYKPVKGGAALMGAPGIIYRNPTWNGEEAELTHEVMGISSPCESEPGAFMVGAPSDSQKDDATRINGADLESVIEVFGKEEETCGTFSIGIKDEPGREVIIGIYASRQPKGEYVFDETRPPKDWNPESVKPFYWKIKDGVSTVIDHPDQIDVVMGQSSAFEIHEGSFNNFSYFVDGKLMKIFINGMLVHEINLPSIDKCTSIVTTTETEIIIKAVNMSDGIDPIDIELDVDVEDGYEAEVLTGDRLDMNSIDIPEKVKEHKAELRGASKSFTYLAPACSLNVIRLKKK